MRTVVYGSRPDGHAKVVLEMASANQELELVGLLDDFAENATRSVRGLKVIGAKRDIDGLRSKGIEALLIGFGESLGRGAIAEMAVRADLRLPKLVHPSAETSASARLGDGVQILALAYVGPDAILEAGVLVNSGAVVEHDAVLERGAVVLPHATLTGRVRVGQDATVGAGATVLPDVTIGARAYIGAGAVVLADVAPDERVAGVPARPLGRPGTP